MGTNLTPKKGCCSLCGAKGRQHAVGRCGIVLNEDGSPRRHVRKRKGRRTVTTSDVVAMPVATEASDRGKVVAGVGGSKSKSARAGKKVKLA